MLADLIRGFCKEPDKNYEVYENYAGPAASGKTTIGIVVKEGQNFFDMLAQLASYLEVKEVDSQVLDELEGMAIEDLGPDVVVYFPAIKDYHPLQP